MTTLSEINQRIQEETEKIAQLRKQAEELRSSELSAVIQELRKKIEEYGISAAELKLQGPKIKKASQAAVGKIARYRGPGGEAWSGGRGRKPKWVLDALASGKSLAEFEIRD